MRAGNLYLSSRFVCAPLLFAWLVVSACSTSSTGTPQVRNDVGVTREQVKAALPKLEQLAKETLKKTGVPGMAIAVVYKDEVLFPLCYLNLILKIRRQIALAFTGWAGMWVMTTRDGFF